MNNDPRADQLKRVIENAEEVAPGIVGRLSSGQLIVFVPAERINSALSDQQLIDIASIISVCSHFGNTVVVGPAGFEMTSIIKVK